MKTRAAVVHAPGEAMRLEEVDLGAPRQGECLVEIMAAGLCHTDVLAANGDFGPGRFPVILGHEGAGIVRAVGPGTSEIAVGDHVILLHKQQCNKCRFCLSGKTNLCLTNRETNKLGVMADGTTRFSLNGEPVYQVMGVASFANFVVVPEIALARIRPDAPFDRICCVGCSVGTGVGAALYAAGVQAGDSVLIIGLGGIGLNVAQGARLAGAEIIIGVDRNRDRALAAPRFGVTHFLENPGGVEELVNAVDAIVPGGVDHSFECAGRIDTMEQALACSHWAWGKTTIVGLVPGGQKLSFEPGDLDGRVLRGTTFGELRGKDDLPKIVDWYMEGKINLDDLVTCLPFEEINRGFELMRNGGCIRCLVTF